MHLYHMICKVRNTFGEITTVQALIKRLRLNGHNYWAGEVEFAMGQLGLPLSTSITDFIHKILEPTNKI